MTILSQEDATILGLCAHGMARALDESNYKPEWMDTDLGRALVGAAISLARDNKPINASSVLSRAKVSADGLMGEVITIFKNGYGAADLQDAVDHSYSNYTARQAVQIARETIRLAEANPSEIRKWLPRLLSSQVSLIHDGDSYDPRPSVHIEKPLPKIFAESQIPGATKMMHGGYRTANLLIYAGVSSHGKSVTIRSHVVDLVLQKRRVALVITENSEGRASAEIAAAIAGVDYEKEVEPDAFIATERESSSERRARYKSVALWLNEYLLVYGPEYCNDDRLKRIARWEKPDVILIDYLKKMPGLFIKSTGSQDEVGDFADWLLKFSTSEGVCVITAGQMSKQAGQSFVKTGMTDDVILYGSIRVEQASDLFICLRRHPKIANMAYFRVKKDRRGEKLDVLYEIPLDPKRHILEIPRLKLAENILSDF